MWAPPRIYDELNFRPRGPWRRLKSGQSVPQYPFLICSIICWAYYYAETLVGWNRIVKSSAYRPPFDSSILLTHVLPASEASGLGAVRSLPHHADVTSGPYIFHNPSRTTAYSVFLMNIQSVYRCAVLPATLPHFWVNWWGGGGSREISRYLMICRSHLSFPRRLCRQTAQGYGSSLI